MSISLDRQELTVHYDILQTVFLSDDEMVKFKKTLEQYSQLGYKILACFCCSKCRNLIPFGERFTHEFVIPFGIFCKPCGTHVLQKYAEHVNDGNWVL